MVGVPYNPDNCTFVASQALNANQFNGVVPNAVNTSNHLLLWDFIDEKLYWVNSLTNIIEYELPDASGGQNEAYIIENNGTYNLTPTPTVYGNNYIVLPAGTYMFDLEYDYIMNNTSGATFGVSLFEIRTNTNTALVGVDASDVIVKQRQTKGGSAFIPAGDNINQTIKTEAVTINSSFIVKSSASIPTGSQVVSNFSLRAFKIK
jgi:hypothetical protein